MLDLTCFVHRFTPSYPFIMSCRWKKLLRKWTLKRRQMKSKFIKKKKTISVLESIDLGVGNDKRLKNLATTQQTTNTKGLKVIQWSTSEGYRPRLEENYPGTPPVSPPNFTTSHVAQSCNTETLPGGMSHSTHSTLASFSLT